jgi:hypothetical protein
MQPAAPPLPPAAYRPRRRGRIVLRVFAVLFTLVVLGLVVAGGIEVVRMAADARNDRDAEEDKSNCDPSDDPEDTRNLCFYPERDGREPTDHEAELGDGVRLAGYTATVEEGFVNELVLDDQLGVRVRIQNRDPLTQPYGPLDWKIQTEDGRIVTPTQNEREDALGSGQLDRGESIEGTLVFDLDPGTYYVLYRPDLFNRARGIWRVQVEAP